MSPQPDHKTSKATIPSVLDHGCERPACADIQQMLHQHQQQMLLSRPPNTTTKGTNTTTVDAKATSSSSNVESRNDTSECPADTRTLGSASWTLLHSMVRVCLQCIVIRFG